MKITHYSFGKVVIDGKTYTSDVVIYPDRVDSSWWRKEGHSLDPEDLKEIINEKPDILVIGTGNMGVMRVPEKTIEFIKSKDIKPLIEKTGKAVEIYGKTRKDKKVIAAFHLTC
jgi:hypothetical protein